MVVVLMIKNNVFPMPLTVAQICAYVPLALIDYKIMPDSLTKLQIHVEDYYSRHSSRCCIKEKLHFASIFTIGDCFKWNILKSLDIVIVQIMNENRVLFHFLPQRLNINDFLMAEIIKMFAKFIKHWYLISESCRRLQQLVQFEHIGDSCTN